MVVDLSVQDDMASVSSRSVGVGSEVGELVDVAVDDGLQASGVYCLFTYRHFYGTVSSVHLPRCCLSSERERHVSDQCLSVSDELIVLSCSHFLYQ